LFCRENCEKVRKQRMAINGESILKKTTKKKTAAKTTVSVQLQETPSVITPVTETVPDTARATGTVSDAAPATGTVSDAANAASAAPEPPLVTNVATADVQTPSADVASAEPDSDAELAEKWQQLQEKAVVVPDFVRKIAPDWMPGQMLPQEVMFHLYADPEFNQKYTKWCMEYREVDEFCHKYLDPNQLIQKYYPKGLGATFAAGDDLFLAMRAEKLAEEEVASTPLPQVRHKSQIYLHPEDDFTLAARFRAHLERTPVKGQVDVLRNATISTYFNVIFSNSREPSFSKHIKQQYGSEQRLFELLLSYNSSRKMLDETAVYQFIDPKRERGGA
jgi:hypothetical protein